MRKKIILFIGLLFLIIIPSKYNALNEVNIYFFYSNDCSYCSQEKAFLEALKKDRYPNIRIHYYDISSDQNLAMMNHAKSLYNVTTSGVPFTIIGDVAYTGFSQSKKCPMQKNIYEYSYKSYENRLGKTIGITYSTELVGDVEEYDDNEDYVIEEAGSVSTDTNNESSKSLFSDPKISATVILLSSIIVVGLVYLFLIVRGERF